MSRSSSTLNKEDKVRQENLKLVQDYIQAKREKLLDISNRNNLINLRFTSRSNRILRIIDELPDQIFEKLKSGKTLKIIPLPHPKDELEDEQTDEFIKELTEQKNTNEIFIEDLEKLGDDIDETDVRYLKILRKLKDEIRDKLGLPKRPAPEIMKIEEYAKAYNINPKFEVPEAHGESVESHTDDNLQTLFYPEDFERKSRALSKEAKRSIDERGTNTLHISFGCLEWEESNNTRRYSPLTLMQVQIKEVSTSRGSEFELSSDQPELIHNISLKRRLSHDFNIEVPLLDDEESPESYFKKIKSTILERHPDWKVRRFVTLAIHNYSKMSMYEELDPKNWQGDLGNQDNILELVTGSDRERFFSEIYDVDEKEISSEVPLLIDEADSSQFSAIYEAMTGRNLAIQGPPGTGKSTTIANMIASLMFKGKKVLFVAEKKAALDVVYKKLEDKGLGDFAFRLPSTAEKKTEILQKLKRRDEMDAPEVNRNIASDEKKYNEQKQKIRDYGRILSTRYFKVEKTGAEVLNTLAKLKYFQDQYPQRVNDNPIIDNVSSYTRNELNAHIGDVESLERISKDITEKYDSLKNHPWYGVVITKNNPYEIEEILKNHRKLLVDCEKLIGSLDNFRKLVNNKLTFYEKNISSFVLPCNDFKDNLDETSQSIIKKLVEDEIINQFIEYYDLIKKINDFKISEKAVSQYIDLDEKFEISKIKRCIKIFKKSIFIISFLFDKDYREAKKYFGYVTKNIKYSKQDAVVVFNQLIQYLNSKENIQSYIKKAKDGFKVVKDINREIFLDENTSFENLAPIKEHIDIAKGNYELLKAINTKISDLSEIKKTAKDVLEKNDAFNLTWKNVVKKIDVEKFFNFREENKRYQNVIDKIQKIDFNNKEILSQYIQINFYVHGSNKEISNIYNAFVEQEKDLAFLAYAYKFKIYNSLARKLFEEEPNLSTYNALILDEERHIFRELDEKLFKNKRDLLVNNLLNISIPEGRKSGSVKDLSQRSLLNHEWNKKKMHIPYRQLFKRAGEALRSMNPCYMLSPVSLSQIVEPKSEIFDVLIIDEASQMPIEEALGAILRSKQAIIVGDPMQLPPTNFFSAGSDGSDLEDDNESILELALSRYQPMRMLRWHYRSRSESLINFSNYYFYDNNLIIPPSSKGEFAINYHYIDNAVYQARVKEGNAGDRTTKGGVNVLEANKIATGVINFMKGCVKQNKMKSCLVVTMNNAQRDLIDEEIRLNSHQVPEINNYLSHFESTTEPFTVKNLENVQGDERDVIFISTLFGPDKNRRVMQRFGPINNPNGFRRLNVLFTRAKEKIELYSSMKANDITEGGERGKQILKNYLEYASTQKLDIGVVTGKDTDSDFEDWVKEELEKMGYEAHPQVGVGGFKIDLGIKHHDYPGFLAGVECDGAAYHSSVSARDNDIVRQRILEDLGWNIYRIWSTNWFKNPQAELIKLDGYLKSLLRQ